MKVSFKININNNRREPVHILKCKVGARMALTALNWEGPLCTSNLNNSLVNFFQVTALQRKAK